MAHEVRGGEKLPGHGNVIEPLQPQPEGLATRLPVAFASQKPPQARHEADRRAQARRLRRQLRCVMHKAPEGLPFMVVKEHRTGDVRRVAAQLGQMQDPPRHDHVDGQAVLQPPGATELPLFSVRWYTSICQRWAYQASFSVAWSKRPISSVVSSIHSMGSTPGGAA